MPLSRSSVFLKVIEELSKSPLIGRGDFAGFAKELLYNSAQFLKINRVNVWMMNEANDRLTSLISYDKSTNEYSVESDLLKDKHPLFFNHISNKEFIVSVHSRDESFYIELMDDYILPNDIYSMMEVPILSGGKLSGTICFESTGEERNWSSDEQNFVFALSQLFIITLETHKKNSYREELEKSVREKSLLIAEINHRVKNNLAVITALIRTEMERSQDVYHRDLFNNLLLRTLSLATLQNTMYNSGNYAEIEASELIRSLIDNMNFTYSLDNTIQINYHVEPIHIDINKSIPFSLIINEIVTNSFKHAFNPSKENKLNISLTRQAKFIHLHIEDNGSGLPENYKEKGTGFGIIEGLADQIDAELEIKNSQEGTSFDLYFQ